MHAGEVPIAKSSRVHLILTRVGINEGATGPSWWFWTSDGDIVKLGPQTSNWNAAGNGSANRTAIFASRAVWPRRASSSFIVFNEAHVDTIIAHHAAAHLR